MYLKEAIWTLPISLREIGVNKGQTRCCCCCSCCYYCCCCYCIISTIHIRDTPVLQKGNSLVCTYATRTGRWGAVETERAGCTLPSRVRVPVGSGSSCRWAVSRTCTSQCLQRQISKNVKTLHICLIPQLHYMPVFLVGRTMCPWYTKKLFYIEFPITIRRYTHDVHVTCKTTYHSEQVRAWCHDRGTARPASCADCWWGSQHGRWSRECVINCWGSYWQFWRSAAVDHCGSAVVKTSLKQMQTISSPHTTCMSPRWCSLLSILRHYI